MGEIPDPYSWDRYNFNPSDVMGNVTSQMLMHKTTSRYQKKKILKDLNGYRINKKGYLVDINGNLVSRTDGEIKLDFFQLNKDGDIPMTYTYDCKLFHLKDCIGEFEKDPEGNAIIYNSIDAKGDTYSLDVNNREVNPKGYLLDNFGNVVTQNGEILFREHEIGEDGEIPKIFSFTKFDVQSIRGDLDEDIEGKPIIILENDRGEILDKLNRRVNSKGYLMDDEGNIINKRGKLVIESHLISQNGEIPKVFHHLNQSNNQDISVKTFTDGYSSMHIRKKSKIASQKNQSISCIDEYLSLIHISPKPQNPKTPS